MGTKGSPTAVALGVRRQEEDQRTVGTRAGELVDTDKGVPSSILDGENDVAPRGLEINDLRWEGPVS